MFNHKHYVPLLKAKEGEFKALQDSTPAAKDLMTPLMEIVEIPWDYNDEAPAKTIDVHLSKLGKKTADAWGSDRRIFFDSNIIEGDVRMSDGVTHHLTHVFSELNANGVSAIPVTGLERHADYKSAVRGINTSQDRGICLRVERQSLNPATLKSKIDADLTFYNMQVSDIDLVIDFDSIDGVEADLLSLTITAVLNSFPYLNAWRTLTFAATSFPEDLSAIAAATVGTIERIEWQVWNILLASGLARIPSFGDYSIANPEIVELDPRILTMSASIRYTADTYWLIARGRAIKRHGSAQYHNLCSGLIARPEYSGAGFSWGDGYISQCAAGTVGPGNATTWRRVANNHHFHKVVDQIASLP